MAPVIFFPPSCFFAVNNSPEIAMFAVHRPMVFSLPPFFFLGPPPPLSRTVCFEMRSRALETSLFWASSAFCFSQFRTPPFPPPYSHPLSDPRINASLDTSFVLRPPQSDPTPVSVRRVSLLSQWRWCMLIRRIYSHAPTRYSCKSVVARGGHNTFAKRSPPLVRFPNTSLPP